MGISIHTLRVEGDVVPCGMFILFVLFQSTPSVWRVSSAFSNISLKCSTISIHTLRVEGDPLNTLIYLQLIRISIHTLRVEGDATPATYEEGGETISIHTLRVEGDMIYIGILQAYDDFNPHPPCGGWRLTDDSNSSFTIFQSTPSVWRVTMAYDGSIIFSTFQSTPSVWRVTLF